MSHTATRLTRLGKTMSKTLADMTAEERAEIWKPVSGYEGSYEVSNLGNVRSLDRIIFRRDGTQFKKIGQPIKKKLTRAGYHVVTLWDTPKPKHFFVHRLVLEAFDRKRLEREVCRHIDDNPLNNRLENINWGTPSENNLDMVRNGLHPMKNRTHCPRGHNLKLPNLVQSALKHNRRDCLACSRARGYLRRHKDQGHRFNSISDEYYEKILADGMVNPHV